MNLVRIEAFFGGDTREITINPRYFSYSRESTIDEPMDYYVSMESCDFYCDVSEHALILSSFDSIRGVGYAAV